MVCSIIIPVFNQLFYTKLCLEALKKTIGGNSYEIIIVDNGSTDGTKKYIEETFPEVKYIYNTENLGFAKGCNVGAASASGEYMVFLNNDTVPTQGWLSALMETAKSAGVAAAIGSKLLFPNGRIQHSGMTIGEDLWPRALYYTFPEDTPGACRQRELQAVTAACMLVGRKTFRDLGGFDERFLNSFEDIDFCIRLREAGGKVIYCPQSILYHFESASEGRLNNDEVNRQKLIEKWGEKLVPDEAKLYREDGFEEPPKPDYLYLTGRKLSWLLANKEKEIQKLTDQLMQTYAERDEHAEQVTVLYERIEALSEELHRASKEKIDLAARSEESYKQRDEYARQINGLVEQLQESYKQIDYYAKETNKKSGEYSKQIISLSDQLRLMADRLREAYAEAEKYASQARQYAEHISANEKEIANLHSKSSQLEAILKRYRSSLPLKIYFKLRRRNP